MCNEPTIKVPILAYHQVMPAQNLPPSRAGLVVDARSFRWQMCLLRLLGFRAVSLDHVVLALDGCASLPARAVVITFDDGYAGVYTYAFPALRRVAYTATVFLIAEDFADATPATRARAYPVVTHTQVREMLAQGLTVGSHTLSHQRLSPLPVDQVQTEVNRSKAVLEQAFGDTITTFCYPYGDTSPTVVAAVSAAGYTCATTTRFGRRHRPGQRYLFKRIPVGLQQNLPQFLYRVLSAREEL
jgi:peptidoglycan/xylan/chitin deacetylase (PgdA/CDA1 family)